MAFYTIHPRDISSIIMRKNAVIIDVREPEEYREYHYRNALNYPYESIETWICRLRRGRTLILYCEYGSTSLLAARRLSREGYEVYTVTGGIQAIKRYLGE